MKIASEIHTKAAKWLYAQDEARADAESAELYVPWEDLPTQFMGVYMDDAAEMLAAIGVSTLDQTATKAVKEDIEVPEYLEDSPWASSYTDFRKSALEQVMYGFNSRGGSWVREAALMLHTAGIMSPEQGSYHHHCLIVSKALGSIYEAMKETDD